MRLPLSKCSRTGWLVSERAPSVSRILYDIATCPASACSLGRAVPSVQAIVLETFARGVAENAATRARFRLFPLLLMILAMVS